MSKKTVQERLSELQRNLKVGKGQTNKFGGYNYRSSEDILEAVKGHLEDGETITVDEDMVILTDGTSSRFYKKSVATFTKGEDSISKNAFTREDENQKGMSSAQLSGSVGSYGKKYALGNLLAIDDTKDDDATNNHGKAPAKNSPVKPKSKTVTKPKKTETPEAKDSEEKKAPARKGNFRRKGKGL